MIDIERALNLPPQSSVTAKSCARCGNRRRTEEHPTGELLIPPYWDRSIGICLQCARELSVEHDRDGWPDDPLDENGQPTIVGWGDADGGSEIPGAPATPKDGQIKIEGWDKDSKSVPIYCEGGPLHKTCFAAYAYIQVRIEMDGGFYEYSGRKYVWHQEA